MPRDTKQGQPLILILAEAEDHGVNVRNGAAPENSEYKVTGGDKITPKFETKLQTPEELDTIPKSMFTYLEEAEVQRGPGTCGEHGCTSADRIISQTQ